MMGLLWIIEVSNFRDLKIDVGASMNLGNMAGICSTASGITWFRNLPRTRSDNALELPRNQSLESLFHGITAFLRMTQTRIFQIHYIESWHPTIRKFGSVNHPIPWHPRTYLHHGIHRPSCFFGAIFPPIHVCLFHFEWPNHPIVSDIWSNFPPFPFIRNCFQSYE